MKHEPSNFVEVPCHIDDLKVGDTVIHNDQLVTVDRAYLKHGGFMGTTFRGDSYSSGRDLVRRVQFRLSKDLPQA